MFFENVAEKLSSIGFFPEDLGQAGVFSYIRREKDQAYLIHIVNLPDEPVEAAHLYYVLQGLERKVEKQCGCNVESLHVYVTGLIDNVKGLCREDGNVHWIIDKRFNRLIIYENQKDNFCGCKEVFEKALLSPQRENKSSFIPYITYGLVIINVLLFVFMNAMCSNSLRDILYSKGALYWPAVVGEGQIYRIFTYMFLHADIQHVSNNMLLLFFVGAYVEEYMGRGRFVLVYFVSGFLAGTASMGYNILMSSQVWGIGASGAIFGVVGAVAGLLVLSQRTIKEITPPRLIFFIVLSLMSGFENKGIDNMAHIGGLVSGFVISLILIVAGNRRRRIR